MAVYLEKVPKNNILPLIFPSRSEYSGFKNLSNNIHFDFHQSTSFLFRQGSVDGIFLVVTTLLICLIVKKRFQTKLISKTGTNGKSRIPQASLLLPFRIPLIDGFYNLIKFRKDGVKALEEMSAKYGYFYEVAIGTITATVVADASIAQKVLCSSDPTHLNKPQAIYGRVFIDWFQDGLVNSEYSVWSPHRKMLSRCFTYKSLQHYLKIMNKHARNLMKNLISVSGASSVNNSNESVVEANEIFDIIYCHAMKIIAQMLMGVDRFSEETIAEFTRNFHAYKHLVLERLMNPHLRIEPYWRFHPKKKIYDKLNSYLTGFMMKITQMHRKEREEMKDNGEYENVTYTEEDNEFDVGEKPFRCVIEEMLHCGATDKEIYDEVGTLLGTGHETSVVSIQMLLLNLALNPDHQKLCREEVDNLFLQKCSDIKNTDDLDLTMDDLAQLKYLERCVLESGRITSTVPGFVRRLDSPLEINDDLKLSAGTNVAILPWVLHKNPKYFPSPDKFDPDRFLPENVKQRHHYAYIPFSGGVRNCIGWKVAIMEVKVIMTWILRHFEIFSDDKMDDVKLLFEVTLLPERNHKITLRRRKMHD